MNCNQNCHGSKFCTCRILTTAEQDEELEKQWRSDIKAIAFVASCLLSFFLIALFWGMR